LDVIDPGTYRGGDIKGRTTMYNIHNLAITIEDKGLDAVLPAVREDVPALVEAARAAHVNSTLVDVMAAADQPDVARFRAYLLVRRALDASGSLPLLAA
jgi:hypothetical protein